MPGLHTVVLILAGFGGIDLTRAQGPLPPESAEFLHERERLSKTVWQPEQVAQAYESAVTQMWDRLRAVAADSHGAAGIFKAIECDSWLMPDEAISKKELSHGITASTFDPAPARALNREAFASFIDGYAAQGFRLAQCEFHHTAFEPGERPVSSTGFLLHLENPGERMVISGDAIIEWNGAPASDTGTLRAHSIRLRNVKVLTAPLQAGFVKVGTLEPRANEFQSAHPVLLADLDGDGDAEIVIPRWNRRYTNELATAKPQLIDGAFLKHWKPQEECGLIADLTGDGRLDFVTVVKGDGLTLYVGGEGGTFPDPGRVIFQNDQLLAPMALTAGDIDADGDLDVFLTQYKPSYVGGQMPTPFYDANDGYPSFLLRNEGDGTAFVDITAGAGLTAKRNRRTYSASFVDLDGDSDLDLSVVSDYAGIDLYLNDGRGKFSDVSQSLEPNRLFGMAQAFADFDGDAQLDLLAIGMSSSTARRLDSLGLGRGDRPDYQKYRAAMGYGNRMFLRRGTGFIASPFNAQIARTGWSWGTSAFDFNNDGNRDIYIANGFRSGKSTKDYCTNYWCHDLYTGESRENPSLVPVFAQAMLELNKGLVSWNGYEHNHLKMNLDGNGFENVAFLMGASFEYDARIAITEDLDRDGREDLLVGEYTFLGRGFQSKFHIYLNRIADPGKRNHWIEFALQPAPGHPVIGSVVTIETSRGRQIYPIVAGDSFLSQDAYTAHFGLGADENVEQVEVRWPGVKVDSLMKIQNPGINRVHILKVPVNH
ncbi:MAG: CRTAC1 family protein [Verrucomicrobiales bacterium]